MKKILIFWYNVTIMISMVLNPMESYASEEIVSLETTEVSRTSEYQVSEVDTVTTEDITTIESSSNTETETSTYIDTTEDLYTTLDTTNETTASTTITDIISHETTTTTENTIDTTITTPEQNIYVENVSIVTNIENIYSYTTIDTTSTSKYIITSTNHISMNNDSAIHTLASANVDDTDASPKTKQITFLIPILLLMVGALFMGATSTPKKH